MYNALRRNIVDTVFRSWRETGFAWEQYDPDSGAGRRTQHFTGWTALVVKIMGMPDLLLEQEQEKPLRPRPIVTPGGSWGWGWGVSWVVWLVVVGVFRREVGRGVRAVRARVRRLGLA